MSLFYPLPSMSFLSFACPSLQVNDHLSSVLGPLMPQGLCACCLLCLVRSSPESLITYALPSFWNLFQCYIIREPFPDNPVEAAFHLLSYMPRFTFLRSTDQPLTHCVFTGLTVNDPSLPGTMWAQTCVSLSLLFPQCQGLIDICRISETEEWNLCAPRPLVSKCCLLSSSAPWGSNTSCCWKKSCF